MNQSTLTVFVGQNGQMIEVTSKTFRSRRDPITGLVEYLPDQLSISELHPSRALAGADSTPISVADDFDCDPLDLTEEDDAYATLPAPPNLPKVW